MERRRILITRPIEDAAPLAALLEARGYAVQIEPLLEIIALPDVRVDLDGVQGILATSANGVRALAARAETKGVALWAVGEATARCARDFGYQVAGCAGGDIDSLVALVVDRADPAAGILLHAAGTHRAGDLVENLTARGFQTRRVVLYRAEESVQVSPGLRSALSGDCLHAALFFSPRTAATFVRLVDDAGLGSHCSHLTAYGLSTAVAERLANLPWRAIRTAAVTTQDSMLALLDQAPDNKERAEPWDAS